MCAFDNQAVLPQDRELGRDHPFNPLPPHAVYEDAKADW